jgi:hypothetical protein
VDQPLGLHGLFDIIYVIELWCRSTASALPSGGGAEIERKAVA